ncbi:MAG: hypothetical protein H0T62_03690 [Parachlamydiaceae bacterium]|nr:hypothetical protein [Parachlamydiaceae bacterium]
MKRLIYGLVFCALLAWCIKISYFALTAGFSVANISSDHSDRPQWDIEPLTSIEAEEVESALAQEYSYLGKGHQAYVFESKDKRYVLKFLKFQKYRHHPIVAALPLPEFIFKILQKQKIHKEEKRDALFTSWKIAFSKLKDQTQVVFIHINRTEPFDKILTLYNKAGYAYQLDLSQYAFLLQRKADLFDETLKRQMDSGNLTEAKALLEGLFTLYQSEYQQGIFEEDRYIVRNTGVIGNKPIQIDTGRLREDDTFKGPKKQAKEILWKTTLLKEWLELHYPELASYFKGRLHEFEQIQ